MYREIDGQGIDTATIAEVLGILSRHFSPDQLAALNAITEHWPHQLAAADLIHSLPDSVLSALGVSFRDYFPEAIINDR